MPKPDPALLNPARYPFSSAIEPRFSDLDLNRHINNVAIAGMLEDSRVRFHRAVGYRDDFQGLSTMVANLSIDYLGETHFPETLTIHGAIEHLGRTSQQLVQVVIQNGKPVVFARTVIVMVGPEGPVPVPESYRARATEWTLRP